MSILMTKMTNVNGGDIERVAEICEREACIFHNQDIIKIPATHQLLSCRRGIETLQSTGILIPSGVTA